MLKALWPNQKCIPPLYCTGNTLGQCLISDFKFSTQYLKSSPSGSVLELEIWRPQNIDTQYRFNCSFLIFRQFLIIYNDQCSSSSSSNNKIMIQLKVNKSQNQSTKFSHTPKNQQNFVHFFVLASKKWLKQKIKALDDLNQ